MSDNEFLNLTDHPSFVEFRRKKQAIIDSDSDDDSSEHDFSNDVIEDSADSLPDSLQDEEATSNAVAKVLGEQTPIFITSDEDDYESDVIVCTSTVHALASSTLLQDEDETEAVSAPLNLPEQPVKVKNVEVASLESKLIRINNGGPPLPQSAYIKLDQNRDNAKAANEMKYVLPLKVPRNTEQYQTQKAIVSSLESELSRARNALRMIRLENLPDKGKSLIDKARSVEKLLQEQRVLLGKMEVPQPSIVKQNIVQWEQIESGVGAVVPRTFGKKGIERFRVEQQLAVESLNDFHKSLETRPAENDMVDDPEGLKIPLMAHQKRALKWLLWREQQKSSGGILADDMGLGKTLTMISLVLKSMQLGTDQEDEENEGEGFPGGTLVVCPASLLEQWSGEIQRRTKRGLLSFEVHHGANRETKAKRLARNDVVITTYAIVRNEVKNKDALFRVRWRRIVLDEAHQIRNHKSKISEAACSLEGHSRWALTGTPVHNKEQDMYALIKFLRCSPYDDLQVWKMWLADKSTGGQQRMHAIISSLMLRRTKLELMSMGALQSLPEKSMEMVNVKLDIDEMGIYQKVLLFSRTLFARFLHQRAEKMQDFQDVKFSQAPPDPNGEYFKMRNKLLKMNKLQDVKQHDILVLLLRLRQICCHPSLITQMLQGDEDLGNADDDEEAEEMNLLEQLNKLDLNDEEDDGAAREEASLKQSSKRYLNPSHPVFAKDRQSTKIKTLVKILKEKVPECDKAILVSQWTTFLNLIAPHLSKEGIRFSHLNGSIPVNKRMPIIDDFNDRHSSTKVLLLSLTAGGVGLNLVGANHLFLLDLHWNPQLENQAQDRIYRMGQNKRIFVYKLIALDCIEEGIKQLQENKLAVADSLLTGTKKVSGSKLSLQDLKMLFNFK